MNKKYYRITYRCEMRNTPERQAEIDGKTRLYKPNDATKDYTETENFQATTEQEATEHGHSIATEKTAKYFNGDGTPKKSVRGFTVKYAFRGVEYIGESVINDDEKTLHYSFAIDKMTVFEIEYYRCGGNKTMHFSTSAARFNRPKTDWHQAGQAQKSLLLKGSQARKFFDKWDSRHLRELGSVEYADLLKDIDTLTENYYYLMTDYHNGVPFNHQRELSMKIPRNYSAMGGNNSD